MYEVRDIATNRLVYSGNQFVSRTLALQLSEVWPNSYVNFVLEVVA